ncbi:hypothetical protein ACOMHN_045819 [Nucella lapillus]
MLTILVLTLFLFTQVVLSSPADFSYRELRAVSSLLEAKKRCIAERYPGGKNGDDNYGDFVKKCQQDPLELGLIIDASVSIKVPDYHEGLTFLISFLRDYIIGPGKNEVRVAAVSYALGVYVDDSFNLNTDREDVMDRVCGMPFRRGGRTDTGLALKYMREKQMQNTRPGVPKVVVVLTDGNSQDWQLTKSEARLCKEDNITVFAVGVGKQVKKTELYNIAGGEWKQVFMSDSYETLTANVKKSLFTKTCTLVPKPTTTPPPTTTTTAQATQPCGTEYPTDVNFVFSPSAMGLEETSTVTSFISRFMDHEELEEGGFQYGVLSADCPNDEGFRLNTYDDVNKIRSRLHRYDQNSLPNLVSQTLAKRFGVQNGGREDATKVAVIFVSGSKMDSGKLKQSIQEMQDSGVKVFLSATSQAAHDAASKWVPQGTRLLDFQGSFMQASVLVSHLCHLEEGVDSLSTSTHASNSDC